MGTSSSYGGSGGGDWSSLVDALDNWLGELPGSQGPDQNEEPAQPQPLSTPSPDPREVSPVVLSVLRPLAKALLTGGRGSTAPPRAGGGSAALGGRGGGGRSPSGSGRSRARVGRVGGRLAVGIASLRAGEATALDDLGLDLTELRGLDPYRQAQRILQAATEEDVSTTLEEEELATAANHVAIWGLTAEEAPPVEDILRRFIAEYVYEVFLTEGGITLRSTRSSRASATLVEQQVRQTIEALTRGVHVGPLGMASAELAEAAERVLVQVLRIFRGDQ